MIEAGVGELLFPSPQAPIRANPIGLLPAECHWYPFNMHLSEEKQSGVRILA